MNLRARLPESGLATVADQMKVVSALASRNLAPRAWSRMNALQQEEIVYCSLPGIDLSKHSVSFSDPDRIGRFVKKIHDTLKPVKISREYVVNFEAGMDFFRSIPTYAQLQNTLEQMHRVISSSVLACGQEIINQLPMQTIHGDIHPGNIILSNGVLFMIDWERSVRFLTSYELIRAGLSFAIRTETPQEFLRKFIKSYHEEDEGNLTLKEQIYVYLCVQACDIEQLKLLPPTGSKSWQYLCDKGTRMELAFSMVEGK